MSVAIIDSGGANIASVRFALQRLGADTEFTSEPRRIRDAQRVILPGVGAAASAMSHLRRLGLVEVIRSLRQPVLGICLGMQLLYERSEEGDEPCLGLLPGRVTRLPASGGLRIPHMGWNSTQTIRQDPLMAGLDDDPWFYFVHSYAAPLNETTLARTEHGAAFSAVVRRGNFQGAQFHPERSARDGARLLRNFLAQ